MGRVTLESVLGRRSARTVLAAAIILAAIESPGQGARQEERPPARAYHGAAVVNGKIYVIGGAGEDNKPGTSVQLYDPATGTWAARANMPTVRGLFGTSAVGGTIYAIGGTTRGRDKLAVVEAYDTATDTWTRRADMPTPRNALSAAVVDGKIYAIGGWGYDRP
jgi:N-acetylneuraminic acid mutarotase